jgi:hypothetical protein
MHQVAMGPLQAHAKAAMDGACDAQITPALPLLAQTQAEQPAAPQPVDYAAFIAGMIHSLEPATSAKQLIHNGKGAYF